MPEIKHQGLQRLKGLGELSKEQYDNFINSNKELISKHGYDPAYINNLYANKQFIDRYGVEAFKTMPDIDMRKKVFKEDIVNEEFDKWSKPTRTNKGLGADYTKYSRMSADAKLKLMEGDYLTPTEFEEKWKKREIGIDSSADIQSKSGAGAFMPLGAVMIAPTLSHSTKDGTADALGTLTGEEASKKYLYNKNQKILDHIFNDDADNMASKLSQPVSEAYYTSGIANMSDSQVRKAFAKAIVPGSYRDKNGMPNLGVPEYASHFGDGSEGQVSSEMEDFSIDEMRQVLAKKKVYDTYMSPEMAMTALNNEAKRYIKEHQGSLKRFGLFAKDVGIAAMSYTADKINGIGELGRMVQDAMMEKPVVMIDDMGNVLDPKKTKIVKDRQGNQYYQGKDGNLHSIHKEQIDYTTLHNMGKNPDGSDIEGAFGIDWLTLNPQYWTRAEQFGTLDEDEQKQYEKLGSSPYKVAYNPNEDSDLTYEAFKMMSFGIADAGSMLIPYGVGALGRTLNTASKAGKIARGFGKVLDTTGKLLTAETRVGQVAQGTAGALGVSYAYNRGAFQETLAQNLANAEEAVLNASEKDIDNQYRNDKNYRAQVDNMINARAEHKKANYLAQMQREGGAKILDERPLDNMFHDQALQEVKEELLQNRVKERKALQEYADLQQKAINGAGDAAFNTFLTEGIKYGFVNNFGFRKFLYTNPAGLQRKMSSSLRGLKEITTDGGLKRMATEGSKFLTTKGKWKEFGKTLGSQAWGGAWTNGTDDMQVDAAERINEDSFNRYLQAYQNGEALADVYGFADGMYSYLKGLSNSMGQETTWNSAIVGGLGSMVNFTPNFANIARFATKEGREAYRNNFRRDVERDKNGIPLRNEDGTVKYKDLGKWNNWREQANYFLQNGVLNTYYGKKQSERDLQSHADYVNDLLDSYDDFKDIEKIVAADIAASSLNGEGDAKTSQFMKALYVANALSNIGNSSKDPATMSSVVQNAKMMLDKASQLNEEDLDKGENPLSEEETKSLLSQYYANNPSIAQNEYENRKALEVIGKNARELKGAMETFDKVEGEIRKIEKNKGIVIDPEVRTRLKTRQALNDHWTGRKERMQEEIGDPVTEKKSTDARTVIASIGGKRNASLLIKAYDRQKEELEKKLAEQKKESNSLFAAMDQATEELKQAEKTGNSEEILKAREKAKKQTVKWQNSKLQERYFEDMAVKSDEKKEQIAKSLEEVKDEPITPLTADEIFALDPVTRANMMRKEKAEDRERYTKKQQREIEKLEKRLLMQDADALQKIQDIALLTQRIETNKDAYSRVAENPEAAAYEFERQREVTANEAQGIMNQRKARARANSITKAVRDLRKYSDVTEENLDEIAYKMLKQATSEQLGIIDDENLLPKFKHKVEAAKRFVRTIESIGAVIAYAEKEDAWKNNLAENIQRIVDQSDYKADLMKNLEKAAEDTEGTEASKDLNYVLDGLEGLGYQRDATVVEKREQRKKREEEKTKREEEKTKREEERKSAEEAKDVVEKKNIEEEKKKDNEEEEKEKEIPQNSKNDVIKGEDAFLNDEEKTAKDGNFAEDKKEETMEEKKKEPAKETITDRNLFDAEGNLTVESETLDEQMEDGMPTDKEVHVSDNNDDVAAINGTGEYFIETGVTTLSGNGMSRYKTKKLKEDGVEERKEGKKEGDNMDKYFDWMDAAGVKLQNIIDHELAEIVKKNPHAKVKFMGIKPEHNATDDASIQQHLMLVMDYDDSINKGITSIHNDSNGGVIESNGKKYLIVGVAGYGNKNASKLALYNRIWSPLLKDGFDLRRRRREFFEEHPTERYYVNEELSTEIVPYSLIPGYIVRQMEKDNAPEFRSVKELLADKDRNPYNQDMSKVAWGIQELSKFLVVGASLDNVMIPRNTIRNAGSAFVLMPASNGKLVPSYLKVLKYAEMKDGKLKERIDALLQKVTSPNYDTRLEGIVALMKLLYLKKDGDYILAKKTKDEISLVHNGKVFKTFVLDSSFDKIAFQKAFEDMNPRVNITARVLKNAELLDEYDEAGALMTDAALFGTAGSSYAVYGLNSSGKMIKPETIENDVPKTNENSDFKKEQSQVIFNHQYYREDNGVFSLDGKTVTDESIIKQLRYNKMITDSQLMPALSKGVSEYYILSEGEHPQIIIVNRNTKEVKESSEEQAKKIIDKINEEKARKQREEEAKKALEEVKAKQKVQNMKNASLEDNGITMDEETGEAVQRKSSEEVLKGSEETNAEVEKTSEETTEEVKKPVSEEEAGNSLETSKEKKPTQKFEDLYNNKKLKIRLLKMFKGKWKEAPTTAKELKKFLREKNVEVDSIGTSEEDVEAWIKTIEECR